MNARALDIRNCVNKEMPKIASGDAATLTVPELIRAAGSLRRQLDTVKFSGDTLSPNPAEPVDATDWPFKANSTWFAPKQKP